MICEYILVSDAQYGKIVSWFLSELYQYFLLNKARILWTRIQENLLLSRVLKVINAAIILLLSLDVLTVSSLNQVQKHWGQN